MEIHTVYKNEGKKIKHRRSSQCDAIEFLRYENDCSRSNIEDVEESLRMCIEYNNRKRVSVSWFRRFMKGVSILD